jgi:4'-phosphopantetheinyl transferase
MSFAFTRKVANGFFLEQNRITWFMNRNNSLEQNIVWHKMPSANQEIASFSDDGSTPNSELQEFLSGEEREHAFTLPDPVERRHYMVRRCFQRLFVCRVLSTNIAADKLGLIHKRDTRPFCTDAPGLNLSFSSSGTTAIACASTQNAVGIDIERLRKVENVIALAKRYFTPEEAHALSILPVSDQNLAFLHYWTAKEAGLKAIGKGIVFGLNTFKLKEKDKLSYAIHHAQDSSQTWSIQYLNIIPQNLIALVEMKGVGNV